MGLRVYMDVMFGDHGPMPLIKEENVVDWSMSWKLGTENFYVPGCSCVPKLTITGFIEEEITFPFSGTYTWEQIFEGHMAFHCRLRNAETGEIITKVLGGYHESMTYRDDGAVTLVYYCSEDKHGDTEMNTPFSKLAGTTSDAITLFNTAAHYSSCSIDTSVINDTDMTGTLGDYYAPVNVPISVSSSINSYSYTFMDALELFCGYTGTFAVINSGVATIDYPKVSEYSLSDEVGAVSDKVYPMYDGSVEPSVFPCRYPKRIYLYYWNYSNSTWTKMCKTIGTYNESKPDERILTYKMDDRLYTVQNSGDSTSRKRFQYNLTNLMFGEITNNKTVPPDTTGSGYTSDFCYYYGSFKTIPTFDFKVGDIVNVTANGRTVQIIIQELTVSNNGTVITSYGSKEGKYEFALNQVS